MVIEIGKCLVSTEILTEFFCCDYAKCKGCCCVVGDSGAPLEEGEAASLSSQAKDYDAFLAEDGKREICSQGYSVVDKDGDTVTPLVPSDGRCAYSVINPDGFTWCAVEKGFEKSCSGIRKPLSCWIFPIRLKTFSTGFTGLMLSREHLCSDAFRLGKEKGIKVYQFLREPIEFKFGKEFYEELCRAEKMMKEGF